MRAVFGSVALIVGGFLLLATLLTAVQFPGVSMWVKVATACLAVVFAIASFILLIGKTVGSSRRRLIVVLSVVTGFAGLVFAIASKNHDLGKYCGIEGHDHAYKLTVRVFGMVLHEESGPAVEHREAGNAVIGPSQDLETKMVCWELGLDAALIAGGAFLGGLLGVVIQHLTKTQSTIAPAKVGA